MKPLASAFHSVRWGLLLLLSLTWAVAEPKQLLAEETAGDAISEIERRLPPKGIEISVEDRSRLQEKLQTLQLQLKVLQTKEDRLKKLREKQASNESLAANLPDVELYAKAVDWALRFDEFYKPDHVKLADQLLTTGIARAEMLSRNNPVWTIQRGTLVRGYRSRIDDSVQPYGLVIPEKLDFAEPVPLYVWLHGRGDKSTDMHFIAEREKSPGKIQPTDGIVLHAFGRQCIGFKSAGEIDIFEAIADVSKKYPIDANRIALMGFSMGGAGAWHVGAHYTDWFAVVHPGAGFAETRRYLNLSGDTMPVWYEQKLWHVYDAPDYVRNLLNVPVIAYSGENDKQKQAADMMEAAFAVEGVKMKHLIGPGMGHNYHPETLKQVMGLVQQAVAQGRPLDPLKVTLQTRTLRYPRMYWVELQELIEHWQDTRVDAERTADSSSVRLTTKNVRRLRLKLPKSPSASDINQTKITIDGQELSAPYGKPFLELVLNNQDRWEPAPAKEQPQLKKKPGLQGPIDDIVLEPFLVVTPSGKSSHPAVEHWVQFELNHFLERWQALYRGEARVKQDKDVTAEDLAKYHVILWGDPTSNLLTKRIADKLPISWSTRTVKVGNQSFDAANHVPLLIYPNPLSPAKYVVLNSGPTHREGHDRTNSLQNPKLPDWAILDLRTSPNEVTPGKVVAADFFDEAWRLKPALKE